MIAWADDWGISGGTVSARGVLIFEPSFSRALETGARLAAQALDEIGRSPRSLGRLVEDFAVAAKRHTARVRWAADAAAIEPLPLPSPPRPAPRVRRRACSVASRYRVVA